jgi:SpoIID/LytB domain protein
MSLRAVRHLAATVAVATALVPFLPLPARAAGVPIPGVVVDGRGYGHGIGMSSWGSYGAAVDLGWSWPQILAHYYGGTTVSTVTAADFGRMAPGTMSVRLTALDGAQTAVVHGPGGASTAADPAGRRWASLVARELPGQRNVYRVYGRADATCPATAANLDDPALGWTVVTPSVTGPVTFRTDVGDDPATPAAALLGVCEPAGTVRYYRGSVGAANGTEGENRTVNTVPLELYVQGVLAREVIPSWASAGGGRGAEALRAQAVASRSFGLSEGAGSSWTTRYSYAKTCDTQSCQVYGGVGFSYGVGGAITVYEDARTNAATTDTAGVVLRTGTGAVASAMFSASSGGRTAGGLYPAVDDPGDATGANSHHEWAVTLPAATVEKAYPAIGRLTGITVTARSGGGAWGGRATSLTISGTNGQTQVTGSVFRTAFGLKSTYLDVRPVAVPSGAAPAGPMLFLGNSVGVSVANAPSTAESPFGLLVRSAYPDTAVDVLGGRCTAGTTCGVQPAGLTVVQNLAAGPRTALVELGYNDPPSTLGTRIDQVMQALTAKGTTLVLWVNLSERRAGAGGPFYAPSNAALRAAATRWPSLRILDWNAASSVPGAERWFVPGTASNPDWVHLTTFGQVRFAEFLRTQLDGFRAAGALGGGPVPPPPPPTTPGLPLAKGARGDLVRTLQQGLNTHGLRVYVDGIFGNQTEGAVRTFQTARGLPATGIVDQATWNLVTTPPSAPPATTPGLPLAKGARGDLVRTVQQGLNTHGLRVYVDGIFGNQTEGAVRTFQTNKGLPATGIVDQATWNAVLAPVGLPLAKGARGTTVRTVQTALNANRLRVYVDGIFGNQTEGAVRTYQTTKGLPANGVVDLATWRALGLPG